MKKIKILFLIILSTITIVKAQLIKDSTYTETKITLETKTGKIFGSLITPKKFKTCPVALIIAGSGPTDRDGNNPMMKNNSLKYLAIELANKGIATLRYDKRGIAESKAAGLKEEDLRFENYINDAKDWIDLLKKDKRFISVSVIGHSEGSLIGMIAAISANKYISIAGAGESADKILKTQLDKQPQSVKDLCFPIIDSLKKGKTVDNVNTMLYSLFRPSVQPYLISWFKVNPQIEIKKLTIPILIIQGTKDIQVTVEDAKKLNYANTKSKLVLIEKMNHIFKIIDGDDTANSMSYGDEKLPIADKLTQNISDFILTNEK